MDNTELKPIFAKGRRKAVIALAVGLAVFLLGGLIRPDGVGYLGRLAQGYLYGYTFWMAFTLGGLALIMLHHMVSGAWGFLVQRLAEAAARTLPIMIVLFIPIAIGMQYLYPWHPDHAVHAVAGHHGEDQAAEAHADEAAHGADDLAAVPAIRDHHELETVMHAIHVKESYLNSNDWLIRAAIYFAIWLALTWFLTYGSNQLDRTANQKWVTRMKAVGSVGMVIFFLTMTFAATDWTMSAEPTFFSTMYPPIFIVGAGLTILAFSIIMVSRLKDYKPLSNVYNLELAHHLGNLLLAFTVLWAYVNFSQYLIIYSGNLAEEIPYYLRRDGGGLLEISVFLMTFHFMVPFFILLWRRSKRHIGTLKLIAMWMIAMRLVDLYWVITPAFVPDAVRLPLVELGAVLAIGGVWMWVYYGILQSRNLLTQQDPRQVVAFAKWEGAHTHA